MKDTLTQGRDAEAWACDWLQAQGLKLITRNYRSRYGELDLVMEHGQTLVFVEVKYRGNNEFGGAVGAVTKAKQAKLLKTALLYVQEQKPLLKNLRFDVIALQPGMHEKFACEWLQNVIEQHQG
ncbi:MAG TPA: YraN family protein [Gammaproteobacteria bacterium]